MNGLTATETDMVKCDIMNSLYEGSLAQSNGSNSYKGWRDMTTYTNWYLVSVLVSGLVAESAYKTMLHFDMTYWKWFKASIS